MKRYMNYTRLVYPCDKLGIEVGCSSSTIKLVLEDVRFGTITPRKKLTLTEKKNLPQKVKNEVTVG